MNPLLLWEQWMMLSWREQQFAEALSDVLICSFFPWLVYSFDAWKDVQRANVNARNGYIRVSDGKEWK